MSFGGERSQDGYETIIKLPMVVIKLWCPVISQERAKEPDCPNTRCFISCIFSSTITAYYNPDEDEANAAEKKTSKNALGLDAGAGFVGGDRKNSEIIVNQPLARHCSVLGWVAIPSQHSISPTKEKKMFWYLNGHSLTFLLFFGFLQGQSTRRWLPERDTDDGTHSSARGDGSFCPVTDLPGALA